MSTAKTRYFLFGSAAILTAGLAAGTVAYMGGMPRALASNTGPDELSLVPAGAAVVAYANVQGVMTSEFRQRLNTLMDNEGKGRQEFQEQTGIDVERDIDAVIAAMSPAADGTANHGSGFVALRGRFDIAKIEALVTSKGGQLTDYKGARLLVAHEEEGESPRIALVNAGLVIVGSEAAVKAAIDRNAGDGTASITSDGEFVRMLESVDQNSTVWAIGRPKVLGVAATGDGAQVLGQQLPEVRWFAASGHLNGGLTATVRAEGKDAEAGKNMREVVQGVLALARLQLEAKPELKPLLNSVTVEGTGSGVAVHMTLPAEMLDVIVKQASAVHGDHMKQLHEMHRNAEN
ncbi:hypothetical protein TBR22_A36930 [Luteitalea sp. TBR-22]|uniref:DUF3352 domain-containing protein n=1 Tax=Luteitalea sp. TBR-22 TaxID=2802971 RepID=UPI001AFB1A38|nr:DUF3352 domain-containing protein [Luteitalea sp. TBR-22]BCS34466.1 hypothetical protein TBR22_A36930 [Luteitalea sp. TBR-22]